MSPLYGLTSFRRRLQFKPKRIDNGAQSFQGSPTHHRLAMCLKGGHPRKTIEVEVEEGGLGESVVRNVEEPRERDELMLENAGVKWSKLRDIR